MKKPALPRSLMRRMGAILVLLLGACASPGFDLQSHRGGRGLWPENTLAAMRQSIAMGVTTLETDLAMTRDGVLVLAHDPHLNPALVRDAQGRWLSGRGATIHSLSFSQLSVYDIGRADPSSRYAQGFPQQKPLDGERFPTLESLFALVRESRLPLRLNIETKLTPLDPEATASPEVFAHAVVNAVRASGLERRVTVQSFDWRTLLEVKRLAPGIATACLTIESGGMNTVSADPARASAWHAGLRAADHGGTVPGLVKAAGCDVWSMFWRNITPDLVVQAKGLGLQVIPWTVNEREDMRRLIAMGVNGIITDYPDRLREEMQRADLPLPPGNSHVTTPDRRHGS